MKKFDELIDPTWRLPDHCEMVYVKLNDEPDKLYYGCYLGLGVWSCLGLGRSVYTRDIAGWKELPLGVDPFQDDI